jgi:hypothetical protein
MPRVEKRNVYRVSVGNLEETGHFEDPVINRQIILKQI